MDIFLNFPDKHQLETVLKNVKGKDFTYPEVGSTKNKSVPGYDNDLHSIYLGKGTKIWDNAKDALHQWQQFPLPWTHVFPKDTPLNKDEGVIVLFKLFGLWWVNPARIVYSLNEPDRYGFAYGTLEGHVEQGEECFWIERNTDGKIYYKIKAFSKPKFWGTKLIYPIARRYQRKFVRESMARMKNLSQGAK